MELDVSLINSETIPMWYYYILIINKVSSYWDVSELRKHDLLPEDLSSIPSSHVEDLHPFMAPEHSGGGGVQMVSNCLRNQAEQTIKNKPVKTLSPRGLIQFLPPSSCTEILPFLPAMMDWNMEAKITPSLQDAFGHSVSHSNRK